MAQPYSATANDSPHWWHNGQLWSVLADGARTDGSFSIFEIIAPRGTGESPHLSMETDAFYYLLEGAVEMLLGEEVHTASKGDFVFVPRATPHARRTTSDSARLLHLCTPAGFERVLQLFGERTEANTPPSSGWTSRAVDETRSQRLFEDLGLRPLNLKW